MHVDNVESYFSSQAPAYRIKSARAPWSWLRSWEMKTVFDLLGDVRGHDVLEFGSGAGFYTQELIARGARHVWAVDVSAAMLDALPGGPITGIHGDAATVKLDQRFAALLSTGMLEFVSDPTAVLQNAADHAQAGARCVLMTPRPTAFGYWYRAFHRAHGVQIRLFDREELGTIAAAAGWRLVGSRPTALFSLVTRLQRS
jgi:SAM-dependent methyltransferase